MKTVILNLNIISIPENTQPENIRPCPRVNVFQHPISPADITKVGSYNYSIELEDDGRCGIDTFGWANNKIDINTDLPIIIKSAGENLDQIQKSVNITEAGTYNISISIN
jgi:hypothetical protein